jgi:hypothetical protein
MIVARTVEPQIGGYWLAAGEAYGRVILAEGETRVEAMKAWTSSAADRQAKMMELEFRKRRVL